MSKDNQPEYRPMVFRDRSAGFAFLTRSTAATDRTITWDDGQTYPVVDVEISSESHPFHTGRARAVDPEGEVAKFQRRYSGQGVTALLRPTPEEVTPDRVLHTGAEGEVSAEDLVLASGRDLTPENLEWASRKLAAEGRVAVEKQLP